MLLAELFRWADGSVNSLFDTVFDVWQRNPCKESLVYAKLSVYDVNILQQVTKRPNNRVIRRNRNWIKAAQQLPPVYDVNILQDMAKRPLNRWKQEEAL